MKTPAIALLLCLAALPATAEVFKCKQPDASVAYQQTPCAQDTAGARMALDSAPPPAAKRSEGDLRAQKDAYESRMARQDYEGALSFASTDKERHRALKQAEDKRLKCGPLAIRAQQAQANVKPKSTHSVNAAVAAEREYNLRCR